VRPDFALSYPAMAVLFFYFTMLNPIPKFKTAGMHPVVWNASGYSSGLYLMRLEAGSYTATRRLQLVK